MWFWPIYAPECVHDFCVELAVYCSSGDLCLIVKDFCVDVVCCTIN